VIKVVVSIWIRQQKTNPMIEEMRIKNVTPCHIISLDMSIIGLTLMRSIWCTSQVDPQQKLLVHHPVVVLAKPIYETC
jgi:hypothetical protein